MRGAGTIWLVAVTLLASAALTSCGGGENDSEDAGSTAAPMVAALGEFVEVDGSKLRVNGVMEAPTIEAIADIPPSKQLFAFDVTQIGTIDGRWYNVLFFGLLDSSGQNVAVHLEPGLSAVGLGNPGALLLVPVQPPLRAGVLAADEIVRGFVHLMAPEDAGPLTFAVLDKGSWVPLATFEGEAASGSGVAPVPMRPEGLPIVGSEDRHTLDDSVYTVRDLLDPWVTSVEAPAGTRFIALDIQLVFDGERVTPLDFAVQDMDGYVYRSFFDLGMARPPLAMGRASGPALGRGSLGGSSTRGMVTFAVREDATLLLLLVRSDVDSLYEPIATFGAE